VQIALIREEYLIVILDDFLLGSRVEQPRLSELVHMAVTSDFAYLRLVPLGRSLLARVTGWFPPEIRPSIQRIPSGHPFYSSLQIAIWRKRYLQSILEKPLSVWEFEHESMAGSVHCTIKDRPPFTYRHVVERGRWLPDASSLLQRAGLPAELGERPVWPKTKYARLFVDHIRWLVLGHSNC
jgi:hypothetical protein